MNRLFALINSDSTVERVNVVDPAVCLDSTGNHSEQVGAAWLNARYGGKWVETGIDFRGCLAHPEAIWDEDRQVFYPLKEYPSHVFDEDNWVWVPPISVPDNQNEWYWDEPSLSWVSPPAVETPEA